MDHEVAWNWLWENVDRIVQLSAVCANACLRCVTYSRNFRSVPVWAQVSNTVSLPVPYEKAVRGFMLSLDEAGSCRFLCKKRDKLS